MSDLVLDGSGVIKASGDFRAFAGQLEYTIKKINREIEIITDGALKGSAVDALNNRYEVIREDSFNFSKMIYALADNIEFTAKKRLNINDNSSSAL